MKSIKGGFIMNEHEIFNSDEDDVLVETKQTKKECKCSAFWANLFSFEMLPVFLSVLAMFFSLFTYFLPLVTTAVAAIVFFFISFGLALSALIISLIPMVQNKRLTINPQIILSLAAIIVSIPSLF